MVDRCAITYYKLAAVFFLLLSTTSCDKRLSADEIVDKSIEHHGGELYKNIHIEFDFRDRHYVINQNDGKFTYKRIFTNSTAKIRDVLNNDGFTRYVNDTIADISNEWKRRYGNSVNSVAYFALLPYGLNDPAVIKSRAGEATIEGQEYYQIHVGFKKKGGGEDHDDEFMYWINKKTFRMDYMAYFYHTDGGGTRFRKAMNVKKINGIILSDYKNYGFDEIEKDLSKLSNMYKANELDFISDIRLNNIIVNQLN